MGLESHGSTGFISLETGSRGNGSGKDSVEYMVCKVKSLDQGQQRMGITKEQMFPLFL